jgi:hypothetical protein
MKYQSEYNTIWMKEICSLVDSPQLGVEFGVHTGGTFGLLASFVPQIIGIDINVDPNISSWIKSYKKNDDWKIVKEDCQTSQTIRDLPDKSIDLVHYDVSYSPKITRKTIINTFDKLSLKSIIAFDNLRLAPLNNLFQMLEGYGLLMPFAVVIDIKSNAGKVYCTRCWHHHDKYFKAMKQHKTAIHNNMVVIHEDPVMWNKK